MSFLKDNLAGRGWAGRGWAGRGWANAIILSVVCVFIGIAPQAFAAETPAGKLVELAVEKVRTTVKTSEGNVSDVELDSKLRKIIAPIFDFREMSRRSLGANWKKASADQQNEFVELFSNLLAKNYLKKIRENAADSSLEFAGEKTKGKRALVKTTVLYAGETASIDYRMREKNGAWKVYDVIVENIGLVSNYRSEFAGIVKKDGVDGLIEKLKAKK